MVRRDSATTGFRRVWNALSIGWKIVGGIAVLLGITTGILALIDRQAQQRARAASQARLVGAAVQLDRRGNDVVRMTNDSMHPVSRVIVTLVPINAKGQQMQPARTAQRQIGQLDTFEQLPPGHWWDRTLMPSNAMGGVRPAVEIAFTDVNGRHWVRSALGRLRQLPQSQEAYYKLPEPESWGLPTERAP